MLVENQTELWNKTVQYSLDEINKEEVKALYTIIIPYVLLLIIGILGNGLVLIVYSLRYKHSPARVYILFLASVDFSICVFGLPYHVADLTHPYTYTDVVSCKILTFIVGFLFHLSVLGLVVIAVDRYLKICRPLGRIHVMYFGRKRALLTATVISLCVSWPFLVLYGPTEMETPVDGLIGHACFFHDIYFDTHYPLIFTVTTLIVCVVSTCALVVLYSLLVVQIVKRYRGIVRVPTEPEDTLGTSDSYKGCTFSTPLKTTPYVSTEQISNVIVNHYSKDSNEKHENIPLIKLPVSSQKSIETYNASLMEQGNNDTKEAQTNVDAMNGCSSGREQTPIISGSQSVSEDQLKSMDDIETTSDVTELTSLVTDSIAKTNNAKFKLDTNYCIGKSYQNKHAFDTNHDTESGLVDSDIKRGRTDNRRRSADARVTSETDTDEVNLNRRNSEYIPRENLLKASHNKTFSLTHLQTLSATVAGSPGLRIHSSCLNVANSRTGKEHAQGQQGYTKQHYKITKIMLTITIVFILSYTPVFILTFLSILNPTFWDTLSLTETIFCEFFLRFYLVNNICNPFIYGFWDRRFKREIINLSRKLYFRLRDCIKK